MALQIPDGFGQVSLIHTVAGDPQQQTCVVGFRSLTGTTTTDLTEAFDDVVETFETSVVGATGGNLYTGWTFVGGVGIINPSNSAPLALSATIGQAGAYSTGSPLPTNCSILAKKLTGFAGRTKRGRMYLPSGYIGEGSIDVNGFMVPATEAALQTQLTSWMTAIAAQSASLVLLHTDPLEAPNDVTSLDVQPQIATQRRRMR